MTLYTVPDSELPVLWVLCVQLLSNVHSGDIIFSLLFVSPPKVLYESVEMIVSLQIHA